MSHLTGLTFFLLKCLDYNMAKDKVAAEESDYKIVQGMVRK